MKNHLMQTGGNRMKRKSTIAFMMALMACCILWQGCGKDAREMIEQAETALGEAREAEARKYAPEEYISAEESLATAHSKFDNRRYKDAEAQAITARDQAVLARDRALERKQQPGAAGAGAEDQELVYNVPSLYGEEDIAEGAGLTSVEVGDAAVVGAALKDINFDFDRYYMTEDARVVMAGNAQWMKERPDVKIRIEGHCDELGSEEYNIALGEKRARAAMDYLIQLGVSPSRLETISYGESLPLDPGHNDKAWEKNRRAHFAIVE